MSLRQLYHVVNGLVPLLMACDGAKVSLWKPYIQVYGPGVACIDDQAVRSAVRVDVPASDQKASHLLDGPLGGGQADAGYVGLGQGAEALHGEGQVRASLVFHNGVYLIEYQGLDTLESTAAALRGQQNVQGLRSGDEDVGRLLCHLLALGGRGVSGADCDPYLRKGSLPRSSANARISSNGAAKFLCISLDRAFNGDT